MYPISPKSVNCVKAMSLHPALAAGLAGLGCIIEQTLTSVSFKALRALSSANFPTPTTILTPVRLITSARDLSHISWSLCLSPLGSCGGVMFFPLEVMKTRGQ